MVNQIEARQVLGVKEDAGRDEIMKRYNVLLMKHKNSDGEQDEEIGRINEAYNLLMGYETPNAEFQGNEGFIVSTINKMGFDGKKVANYIYYYKFHALISLVVILMASSLIYGIATRVEPDLDIAVAGTYKIINPDVAGVVKKAKTTIVKELDQVKEPNIQFMDLSPDNNPNDQQAGQVKFATFMMNGAVDVFILERENFDLFAERGAFISLDGMESQLGIDRAKNIKQVKKVQNSNEEHLYGIDVTNSSLLKDFGPPGKEKIAVVTVKGKHRENAIKALKLLLK